MKQVLLGIQDLLDSPNGMSPANPKAADLMRKDMKGYRKKIREEAVKNVPDSSSW